MAKSAIITEPREIIKEIKAEVEKPVIKKVKVDKIIEVESEKEEIIRLKNTIKELEEGYPKIVTKELQFLAMANIEITSIAYLVLLTLILTSGIVLAKKKKK